MSPVTARQARSESNKLFWTPASLLPKDPMRDHSRSNLTTRSLRFWTLSRYPNYLIVYLPDTTPLQVVAVLHGKRSIRRILKQRP
jgi:plasmid stabilization system protein ParE